jgi:hypothetical protein
MEGARTTALKTWEITFLVAYLAPRLPTCPPSFAAIKLDATLRKQDLSINWVIMDFFLFLRDEILSLDVVPPVRRGRPRSTRKGVAPGEGIILS